MDKTLYHQSIEALWQQIEDVIENETDADTCQNGSVFTIDFGNGKQIVINKQEPLLELWLASRAGGFHFSYQEGEWLTQVGENFWDKLTQACDFYGENLSFPR